MEWVLELKKHKAWGMLKALVRITGNLLPRKVFRRKVKHIRACARVCLSV